jgi:hypothetical protein
VQATEPPAGDGAARPQALIRYSPAIVLLAIAIASSNNFADPDLWGHVRFGQAALSAGHVIRSDPYSYSVPGHAWLNHEWLSEVIMALSYKALGAFGLELMKLACAAVTMTLLAIAVGETGASELSQIAALLASAVVVQAQFQYRPQIFSSAMMAALTLMLAKDAFHRSSMIWLTIPMLALWANLHGGFIAGLGALAIYAVAVSAADWLAGRGLGHGMRFAIITAASPLATLATPFGAGAWLAVMHALGNPYTRMAIMDWSPLLPTIAAAGARGVFAVVPYAIVIAMMAALAVSWVRAPARVDLGLVAVAAAMSAAAFVAMRNVPLAAIALAPPLAYHASIAFGRVSAARPAMATGATGAAPSRNWWIRQAVLTVAAIAVLGAGGFFSGRIGARKHYPAGAVAFMQSHGLHGNVLPFFDWGEYVIWHLAPGSRVFIDGRYDTVYPRAVIRDYLLFNYDLRGGAHLLDAYPHDFVLLSPDSAANRIMRAHGDWTLVYRDDDALLYARAASPAAKLPGVPITGTALPTRFP